jgi:hypothetical protein
MTSHKFAVPSNVMVRQVGQELVILELSSGTYFGLDPVGARIWQLIVEQRSTNEICAALEAEYDVTADVLGQDVTRLIETLIDKGLVRPLLPSGAH